MKRKTVLTVFIYSFNFVAEILACNFVKLNRWQLTGCCLYWNAWYQISLWCLPSSWNQPVFWFCAYSYETNSYFLYYIHQLYFTDTSNGGVIAGAVIGSFVGIVLIIIIIYFVAFKKKNTGETCMYKYLSPVWKL